MYSSKRGWIGRRIIRKAYDTQSSSWLSATLNFLYQNIVKFVENIELVEYNWIACCKIKWELNGFGASKNVCSFIVQRQLWNEKLCMFVLCSIMLGRNQINSFRVLLCGFDCLLPFSNSLSRFYWFFRLLFHQRISISFSKNFIALEHWERFISDMIFRWISS